MRHNAGHSNKQYSLDENTDEENNKHFPTVSFEYKKKNDARFDVIDKMPEKTFWSIG